MVDWGLARAFQRTTEFRKAGDTLLVPRERIPSETCGFTLGYVSPEQFAGRDDIGPASDIYSLGATLYQILTNQTPLRGSERDFADRLTCGVEHSDHSGRVYGTVTGRSGFTKL